MLHYINKNLKIYVYAMPVLDSRMYIQINDKHPEEALIIDPLVCEEAVDVLCTLSSAVILLTHSHYDHISGVNWLKQKLPCTLICSEICAEKIADSHLNLAAFSSALIVGKSETEQAQCMAFFDHHYTCQADEVFPKETAFDFGSYHVRIQYTPGHSDCSQCICLRTQEKKLPPAIIYTGDSLVNGHQTITRLPSGNKKDYLKITKPFLDRLEEDTLIMPGHGNWATKAEIEKSL